MSRTGNHDITLDPGFYTEHGAYFHNQHLQDPDACMQLVKGYKSIIFLNHESADIQLVRNNGPRTSFRVFGSPFSPRHGLWAFGYAPEQASGLWEQIPLDSDVVITHTPPKYHCDESGTRSAIGCESLRQTMWRVRPSLLICGHVHEGRGAHRVLWDLSSPNVRFKELSTGYWEDPDHNTKKQCLFDLSRRGSEPLQNTGAADYRAEDAQRNLYKATSDAKGVAEVGGQQSISAVRGQGGTASSGRCDAEALVGRMGRKETCVINAAIMASSWPYKANVGRKYNKPIVVDIDLPVWEDRRQDGGEGAHGLDTATTNVGQIHHPSRLPVKPLSNAAS